MQERNYFRWFLMILFVLALMACNKRDLDRLDEAAQDHARRLRKLEKMLIEAQQQVKLIHKLLVEYDGRLTVTDAGRVDNSFYIRFSDGDTLLIGMAETPVISLSPENEWLVNGVNTGIVCKGEDGDDGGIPPRIRQENGMWEISVDGGNTWKSTGVKVQGEAGAAGEIPKIGVGEDGNWYINGEDTGVPMAGKDGMSPAAPQVEVRDNGDGSFNWWIKNGNGEWKDTGVLAIGKDGQEGSGGQDAPYIKNVTVSGKNISFIFNTNIPGTTPPTNVITVEREVDFSYTIMEDGKWVLLPSKPFAIPIGGTRKISFRFPSGTFSNSYGWKIILPDGFEFLGLTYVGDRSFEVKLRVEKGVTEYRSGLIFLTVSVNSGDYPVIIPVSTQLYQIDVKDLTFSDSYVYHVYNDYGEKVAEVCKEYIRDGTLEGKQAVVIYPYDDVKLEYGKGYVTGLGGTVDHTTGQYDRAGGYAAGKTSIYFLSSKIFMSEIEDFMYVTPLGKEQFVPDQAQDVEGNRYPVVKIGSQYWMAEDLQTTSYADGTSIPIVVDDAAWSHLTSAACCYLHCMPSYKKKGVLYNGYAVLNEIAPAGWRVANVEDWFNLMITIGVPEESIGVEKHIADDVSHKLEAVGMWAYKASNTTGLGLTPGIGRDNNGKFPDEGKWRGTWWSGRYYDGKVYSLLVGTNVFIGAFGEMVLGYRVRCVRNSYKK